LKEVGVACEAKQIKLGSKEDREENLLNIIEELTNDPGVNFIKRIGPSEKRSDKMTSCLYSVNWEDILKNAQNSLVENIVEQTSSLGMYHCRVLRILKTKGFLNEINLS
jgi:hypothetical protein